MASGCPIEVGCFIGVHQKLAYSKLLLISPGLIHNFIRGFGWAYYQRGL